MLLEPMAPDVLVWLVNEWGTVPRTEAGEEDRAYPDTELLAGLLSGSGVRDCPPEVLTRDALIRVADHLHPVFATPDPAARVSLTARLLSDTGVTPALDLTGDGPQATWQVDDDRQVLTAAAALTLRDQLATSDPDRIGTCTGRRCADAYIDASPAGQRRFCSVTCQNRARVAAWRQRQRATSATTVSSGAS
jgi:predicted RNA-binding Zn ribbon-like protein